MARPGGHVALALLFCGQPLLGQQAPAGRPDQAGDWRLVAGRLGLNEAEIGVLAETKVLMAGEPFRQVFTPYLEHARPWGVPLFLTSDSLLNAFHVLFQESILRLEWANLPRLTRLLQEAWGALDASDRMFRGAAGLRAAALQRARIVIGVALGLLGPLPRIEDADLARTIAEEVERVVQGQGQALPAWLGPPEAGFLALDYSRFLPRGFYAGNKLLERYFRAVSWLQSIPFRVERDEELVSVLLLGSSVAGGPDLEPIRFYGRFLGMADDWDLLVAAELAGRILPIDLDRNGLESARERIREWAGEESPGPLIGDRVSLARPGSVRPGFRVLSAYRSPESILFQKTTDPLEFPARGLPAALELCAALGSPIARGALAKVEGGKLLAAIERNRNLFEDGGSHYASYLNTLAALLAAPEPGAPAFLSQPAWQAKSCQAVLSGWAQLRHTFVLQLKSNFNTIGAVSSPLPTGFIEPVPEFFARMAHLVRRTGDLLRSAGAFQDPPGALAGDIQELVELIEHKDQAWWEAWLRSRLGGAAGLVEEEPEEFSGVETRTDLLLGLLDSLWEHALETWRKSQAGQEEPPMTPAAALGMFEKFAEDLALGKEVFHPDEKSRMARHWRGLAPIWSDLETLCLRLERLARTQLLGAPLDLEQARFIDGYGNELYRVMAYDEETAREPRDDAPRIADVAADPRTGRYLEVGIGRPRALYVLYPYEGNEVLCRGAVLPFFEFAHPKRLDDQRWRALLDSPEGPRPPAWLRPIMASDR